MSSNIIFRFQPTFVIWFNAEVILLLLKQEPEVAKLAALYLKWVSLGLPAYGEFIIEYLPYAQPTL